MKVILFGATGMVGQGVLRECLRDPDVTLIRIVGRCASASTTLKSAKPSIPTCGIIRRSRPIWPASTPVFSAWACPRPECASPNYERITYGITLAAAETLARLNPAMTFVYVSGAGTDSSEHGASMWARVKGRTENALLALPFKAAYMFRPGIIQPLDGIQPKTASIRIAYARDEAGASAAALGLSGADPDH